ncbi:hypothetical protein [Pseudomonas sp. MBLB4136]|uniref:hypothetical protein n=1 Tax=Pseudomonas sp. MBLB4136 TaxID=3451558 RepID=UPI003F751D9E
MKSDKSLIYKGKKILARQMLYLWHKNNKAKKKTSRLCDNKNNRTEESQTDFFGKGARFGVSPAT